MIPRAYVITQVASGVSCFLVIVWSSKPAYYHRDTKPLLITSTALSAIRIYSLNVCGIDRRLPALVASIGLLQFAVAVVRMPVNRTATEPTLNCRL